MTDYKRLSIDHERRRRNVLELIRTVSVGCLVAMLVGLVVFCCLDCVTKTASLDRFPRPVTAEELNPVVYNLSDRILEARR